MILLPASQRAALTGALFFLSSPHDKQVEQDKQLIARAQMATEGDMRAFGELVARHQPRVLSNCRHLTRSPDDAEDLAQDVFVKAYFAIKGFRGDSSFSSWITRIKTNHCLNWIRSRKNKHFVDVEDEVIAQHEKLTVAAQAPAELEALSERELISMVLDRMKETLRVPLVLRDLDGLSYEEIAKQLGISLSATKMRIKRGREDFREIYSALGGERPSSNVREG